MQPKDRLYDIMMRTVYNLKYIEENKDSNGPYETTQLLNSFIGAVAHPWEKYKQELNAITLDEAQVRGWPIIEKERPDDKDPENLGDLIRLMRNGIAHGNIIPYPDSNMEIRSVLIWNLKPNGTRDWGAVLPVDILRQFLFKFVELATNMHNTNDSNRYDAS